MIKRRVVRRSESKVSILLDPGGNQVAFGAGASYFYECGLEESSNFSPWKSGLTTDLALASGITRRMARCWPRMPIRMSLLDNLPMQAYLYVERLGGGMPIEKSDLLQGTLDMLILKIVELGPVHGYGISQRIRQISKEVLQVQQGSLYPALHRLEKRGWLARAWAESDDGGEAKCCKV